MSRLLAANIRRLFHDKSIRVCGLAMLAVGTFCSAKVVNTQKLDQLSLIFLLVIGFALAIFCSMCLGTEYSDGTIRNKLIIGHKRSNIYLSNLILCYLANLLLILIYFIPVFSIGVIRLGWFEMSFITWLKLIGMILVLNLAYVAIFTMISMLISNKALSVVICLMSMIILLFIAVWMSTRLNQEPYHKYYTYEDGLLEESVEPNPNYITGTKREVFQCGLELLPQGQSLIMNTGKAKNPLRMVLFSTGISVLFTSVGIACYRKKDIN